MSTALAFFAGAVVGAVLLAAVVVVLAWRERPRVPHFLGQPDDWGEL